MTPEQGPSSVSTWLTPLPFLRGDSALGLQCLPPSSVAPLAWDPSMGFPGAAALPPPGSPCPFPILHQLEVGIRKAPSQAQSGVSSNNGGVAGKWSSTACPSLLCSAAGNQLWHHLKWSLTHWALVEFPCWCLSLPICKMGGGGY